MTDHITIKVGTQNIKIEHNTWYILRSINEPYMGHLRSPEILKTARLLNRLLNQKRCNKQKILKTIKKFEDLIF